MAEWLYQRLKSEDPEFEPGQAIQASINWIKSLSIICNEGQFNRTALNTKYSTVQRRAPNIIGDNSTFANTVMSFHNYASLVKIFENRDSHYDLIRSAIISWYYGIYYAASAMISANDGSMQETHASTANVWNRQINGQEITLEPFSFRLETLIKSNYESEIQRIRAGNKFNLLDYPHNHDMAIGGCLSYLQGTAKREREILESRIKNEKEFKKLGVNNFRTKAAQIYRDDRLHNKETSFLHQAFRFRGKANYRDAIYLSYGRNYGDGISDMILNLLSTLKAFLMMSCHYSERRVERGVWNTFYDDICANNRLGIDCEVLKIET
jgi:hypothetical protein